MSYITLKHNRDANKRDHWDIEENDGFEYINGYKINTKYSKKNTIKAATLLYHIDRYIHAICDELEQVDHPYCYLFCRTPHILQEISYNKGYEGINKPKKIIHWKNDFFRDQYRATERRVMLSLRKKNGTLRNWAPMKKLLLHELSHTMCNHILYYNEENHEDDFDAAERYLKNITIRSPRIKSIEIDIENLIAQ